MKYLLLKRWVQENSRQKQIIHKIILSGKDCIFKFKSGLLLVCHFQTSNPFPFYTSESQQIVEQKAEIWQNLMQSELYLTEIADNDRIIKFKIRSQDIYQDKTEFVLVFECMPPKGNLILCRWENDKLLIIDALVKYTYAENPQRQILPGLLYEPPHTSFVFTEEYTSDASLKMIIGSKEVLFDNTNDYFCQNRLQIINQTELADKRKKLLSFWQKELKKTEKKIQLQHNELQDANQENTWLIYSELIKSNLNTIKKGDESITTINYFNDRLDQINIPLKKELSGRDNLSFYLKKYKKAKHGKVKIEQQIVMTEQRIEEIRQVISLIQSDNWNSLDEQLKAPDKILRQASLHDKLLNIKINEEWEILIGRKAKENDLITTQIGKPDDWWFHTRIYHGSHILLRNFKKLMPTSKLIDVCCRLAAWYSKAKHSENVPVDYTQIRYVRKPRKSVLGYVTYSNQKTAYVNPLDVNEARALLLRDDK